MKQEYSFDQVYDATQRGFNALYVIIRNDVKRVWKQMNRTERYTVMRALVNLRRIGMTPDLYLGRACTEAAWVARAQKFAKERGLAEVRSAYYIVPNPASMTLAQVQDALGFYYADGKKLVGGHWYWHNYYNLATDFMRYDYSRADDNPYDNSPYSTQRHAAGVMERAERLSDRAEEIKAHGLKREWLKFVHNLKKYEQQY